MKQFVPMTDDMLYQAGVYSGMLVPYQVGLHCLHSLNARAEESVPVEDNRREEDHSAITITSE